MNRSLKVDIIKKKNKRYTDLQIHLWIGSQIGGRLMSIVSFNID